MRCKIQFNQASDFGMSHEQKRFGNYCLRVYILGEDMIQSLFCKEDVYLICTMDVEINSVYERLDTASPYDTEQ